MSNIFGLQEGTDLKLWVDNAISTGRTAVFVLGGYFVSAGIIEDAWLQKYGSMIAIGLTLAWLLYQNWRTKQKVVSAIQTGQAMPQVVQSEKEITAKLNSGQIVVPSTPDKKENTP